jgi:hypothetical protein
MPVIIMRAASGAGSGGMEKREGEGERVIGGDKEVLKDFE